MVLACGTTEEKSLSKNATATRRGWTTRRRVARTFELAEPECILVWGQVQLSHPMVGPHPLHVSHRPSFFAPGNILTNHVDCNIMLCALALALASSWLDSGT